MYQDYQIDEFGMMRHYSQKLKEDEPVPSVPRDVQNSPSVPEVFIPIYMFNSEKEIFVEFVVI